MPTSFIEVTWIFLIYAFLGWCVEVAYAALETKIFVNRGFLNGPVCPVYGCGILVVIVTLTPLKDNFLFLFVGSFFLTSTIEFITGFLLEKLFHNQWWDYSEENFNICGYVCLKFSILWGLGCTLVMDVIHPTIYNVIKIVPKLPRVIILIILCLIFFVDFGVTVAGILKFNQHLKLMDEIAEKLMAISNEIGENIYEGVTSTMEKKDEWKETMDIKATEFKEKSEGFSENIKSVMAGRREEFTENLSHMRSAVSEKKGILLEKKESLKDKKTIFVEKMDERAKLQKEYNRLMESESFCMNRLTKAFPKMKHSIYQDTFLKWKIYRKKRK